MQRNSAGDRSHRTILSRISPPLCTLLAVAALTACGGGGSGSSSDSGSGSSTGASDGVERQAVLDASSQPRGFEAWEQDMIDYGHRWGKALQEETDYLKKFKLRYYDAQRVHEQIGKYLGETQPWRDYGQEAESNYKQYLENNNFQTAGWERFPHGLYLDWKRTGDAESRDYLELLRDRPPFSWPEGEEDSWSRHRYSREIAYSLEAQVLADRAGHERQLGRIRRLADLALGHIDIWVNQDYLDNDPYWHFFQAFMGGLTGSALIAHYERSVELGSPDAKVPPALERLGNVLWDRMWVDNVNGTGYGAFRYVQPATSGVGGNAPAPDLNMLIAPLFGWLFYHTGDERWLKRGDDIFAGGVALANLESGKRFNQNYRASFQYVDWRTRGLKRRAN